MTNAATGTPIHIRGGVVVDGRGEPAVRADVWVRDGRIERVLTPGRRLDRDATVIDAGGLVVAPGFIDLHSHADYTVETEAAASGQLAQGVTSIVTGNCGWSPFPVADLAALRDWSAFLGGGPSYNWRDLSGFADRVDAAAPALNVLPLLGHAPVRIAVLGGERRAPSAQELGAMRGIVTASLDQGAWGLSTGLIYAPGSFAEPAEVAELVRVAALRGALYASHIRDETGRLLEAVDEAIAAAGAATGSGSVPRLQISHIKAMGPANHGQVPLVLERIDAARAAGLDVAADVYPYTASGTTLASRLPVWALDGGAEALCARLGHPETRSRIQTALAERFDAGDFDPAGIVINQLSAGRFLAARGSTLAEIAGTLAVAPAEAALEVLAAHGGVAGIINHAMREDDLRSAIAHPQVAIASDGGPLEPTGHGTTHPRAFGTFPRVFAQYVREQGVISLEEAVRKCTSLPASRLGLTDRGIVRAGAVADLTLFDPAGIADRATFAEPWQLATGVDAVLVAGQLAWSGGRATGARAGGVLRRGRPGAAGLDQSAPGG